MKKIMALVVVLAVALLGSYYITGHLAERTIRSDVQAFNRIQGLHVELKKFHRGFFKSQAVFAWTLHVPEHAQNTSTGQSNTIPAADLQSEMPLEINHGPIIVSKQGVQVGLASASTEFGLPEPYLTQFQQIFTADSAKPKLTISLYISLLRKTDVQFGVPEFKAVTKNDKTTINWHGFMAGTRSDTNLSSIEGDIVLNGFQIGNDKKNVDQGKLSINYNLNQNDMGLYLGNAAIKVDSLTAKESDHVIFELKAFELMSNNEVENKLFTATMNSTLEKVSGNGKTFGPAKISMTLANLDADALARIRDIANSARQINSPIQKNQAMLAILPELPKLLSKGPRFEISVIQISTPDGTLEGSMKVSLPENAGANVFELLQKIQGQAHFSIPEGTIKMILQPDALREVAAQQNALPPGTQAVMNLNADVQTKLDSKIQNMVQSGLLIKNDKIYMVDVKFEKGQFSVNNKPFNPAMMQF